MATFYWIWVHRHASLTSSSQRSMLAWTSRKSGWYVFCSLLRSNEARLTVTLAIVAQGTSSFIAAEHDAQAFLFEPGSAPPISVVKVLSKRYPLLDGDDDEFELMPWMLNRPRSSRHHMPTPRASSTALSTTSSLWWLGGYFVFDHARRVHRENARKDAKGKARQSAQSDFPEELFNNHDKRHNDMRITGFFAGYASFLPQCLRPAATAFEKLRRQLMSSCLRMRKPKGTRARFSSHRLQACTTRSRTLCALSPTSSPQRRGRIRTCHQPTRGSARGMATPPSLPKWPRSTRNERE